MHWNKYFFQRSWLVLCEPPLAAVETRVARCPRSEAPARSRHLWWSSASILHLKPLCLSLSHPRAVTATGCVEFAMPLIDVCLLRLARGQLSFPQRGANECCTHKSFRPCQSPPPPPPPLSPPFQWCTGPKSIRASVCRLLLFPMSPSSTWPLIESCQSGPLRKN